MHSSSNGVSRKFEYFCPFCQKSHIYELDLTQSVPVDGTVWVKAIAQGCPGFCHFVYKTIGVRDYEALCRESGVLPQKEVNG